MSIVVIVASGWRGLDLSVREANSELNIRRENVTVLEATVIQSFKLVFDEIASAVIQQRSELFQGRPQDLDIPGVLDCQSLVDQRRRAGAADPGEAEAFG